MNRAAKLRRSSEAPDENGLPSLIAACVCCSECGMLCRFSGGRVLYDLDPIELDAAIEHWGIFPVLAMGAGEKYGLHLCPAREAERNSTEGACG